MERSAYDIYLSHNQSGSTVQQGFLLHQDENGLAYRPGLMPELADQQRTDTFSSTHRHPLVDLPATFNRWDLGAGFEDAIDVGTLGFPGYNYTRRVDLSWNTRGYLAPQKQTGGSTVEAPRGFRETSLGLFCWTTRYVYEWTGSAWTERFDAGAGGEINDLFEFTNSTATYLLVALTGEPYQYSTNGVDWFAPESDPTAPAFRAAATQTSTSTSITATEPTGAASGDIIFAHIIVNGGASLLTVTPNTASDWNLVESRTAGVYSHYVFWHRRGGSAPDLVFNYSGTATNSIAALSAYQNCKASGSPIDVVGGNTDSGTDTNFTYGDLTTTGPNRRVVGMVSVIGVATTVTQPSNKTERYDANSTTVTVSGGDQAVAAAGALVTNDKEGTLADGGNNFSTHVALIGSQYTGANDVFQFAARGSSSGQPVLWALDNSGDLRNQTDPTGTDWSAASSTQIGQQSITLGGMVVIDNEFFVVHDGGITSYDGTTVSTVYETSAKLDSDAMRPVVGPDNKLYFTFHGKLRRFDHSTSSIEVVWPRSHQVGNAELNGTITALTFDDEGVGYFALKNGSSVYYICKIDVLRAKTLDGETIYPIHTYFYNASSAVSALQVVEPSSDNFSTSNHQLVIGNGTTADYLLLPEPGVRPEDDSGYRFDTSQGTAYGSFIDFRSAAFPKFLTRGDVELLDADADDTVALQYQEPGGSATTVVTGNSNGRTTATLSSEVEFTKVRPVLLFDNGANTTSPVLLGAVLHAAPNAPRDRVWTFTVRIAPGQLLRNGLTTTPQDAADQSAFLFNARNEYVTFTDLRGTTHNVKVLDIEPLTTRFALDLSPEEFYQVTVAELVS